MTAKEPFYLCGSPVKVHADQYSIMRGLEELFRGRTVDGVTDVAPIFRQVVAPFDWGGTFAEGTHLCDYNAETLWVLADGVETPYNVVWDYTGGRNAASGVYRSHTMGGVQPYIYASQWLPLYFYGTRVEVTTRGDNVQVYNFAQPRLILAMIDLTDFDFELEAWVDVTVTNGEDRQTWRYAVRDCVPDNAATLYFLRPDGSLGWAHFDGKNTRKVNVDRSQITQESGLANYAVEAFDSWTLNTGVIEETTLMEELSKSPAVWMQDYRTGRVFPVVITDKSAEVKYKKPNSIIWYTLSVRESATATVVNPLW